MQLYHYYRSSASYRVRIALNLKGLSYEPVAVDLRPEVTAQRSAQFLALNPEGLVPVLIDGGRALTQSLAIIEYLDETHPQPPLLPRAPEARARVRGLALAIGVLVDAAIVMVENGYRQLSEQQAERSVSEPERRKILLDSAKQVGPALFFSLLIIVVSFLPVFLLEAQEGRMFRPLAWTKTLAVGFSS